MKEQKFALAIAICMLLSFVPSASASSLQADRIQLEEKRRSLESQREKHEKKSKDLEGNLRSVSIEFGKCTSNRWRSIWKDPIERAEIKRRELEKYRKDVLVKLNLHLRRKNGDLEKERLSIEASYKIKNEEYEIEIRNWMNRIETEYFHRLDNELFDGYVTYMNRIEIYIDSIKSAITDCQNKDYKGAILNYVLERIDEIW